MLLALQARICNSTEEEFAQAVAEQTKILKARAPGLAVNLYDPEDALISSAITNEDGRIEAWDGAVDLGSGTYRLVFDIAGYRQTHGASEHDLLFPRIEIIFHLDGSRSRLHIPVLLSNYGYTTYRGS